jgi:hypothetical protein
LTKRRSRCVKLDLAQPLAGKATVVRRMAPVSTRAPRNPRLPSCSVKEPSRLERYFSRIATVVSQARNGVAPWAFVVLVAVLSAPETLIWVPTMLKLKRISDLLKESADGLELHSKTATGKAALEATKMIKELRDAAREILTSQEYQNSKIKF